ncbi:MAG: hypothetical protein PVH61_43360 [Candidatus Aminicenantes bacterium]
MVVELYFFMVEIEFFVVELYFLVVELYFLVVELYFPADVTFILFILSPLFYDDKLNNSNRLYGAASVSD